MPTKKPVLVCLVLLGACLDPKSVGDDDDDDTSGGEGGPSVYDVNDGTVPLDTPVTLEGVVVTSPVNRDGDGFFVADPDGGPGSGLYVWRQMGMESTVMYEGDELTITGTPTEFYGWIELVVDSLDDIQVTGEADMPAPIELGDGEDVDWEEYESTVVTLEAQTITSIDSFNTATLSGGILMDDGFLYLEHDCRGSYDSVTGVIFYQYEAHSINPRDDEDMSGYAAPEAEVTTVAAIQGGELCGPVMVENAVVTGAAADDEGDGTFFVQDAGGGAMSGVAVFTPGAVPEVSVGDTVTITGSADEYYDLTQLYVTDAATDLVVTGTGTPVAESLSEAPEDWEPYEGMLITITGVEVTSDASYGEVETNWGIKLDTLYYEHNAENGATYAEVTGLVYYNYSEWKIEPRDASDLVE